MSKKRANLLFSVSSGFFEAMCHCVGQIVSVGVTSPVSDCITSRILFSVFS